jgi:zinc transport system substrate-binding protein
MRVKRRTERRILCWGAACLLVLLGCQNPAERGKLRVVCSLFPLYEFARVVGGDRAEVSLLLPPGVEPHAWEPRASDLVAISKADLFLCVSRYLEPWAQDVVRGASREGLKVMVAADGFELLQRPGHSEEEGADRAPFLDPHIWLDLRYDRVIVDRIAQALSSIQPDNRDFYQSNARAYGQKLQALDEAYEKGLTSCRHRYLLLGGHAAFSYLARRYNLTEVPLYGVSADSEPTPHKLAEVVEIAKANKAKYIFFETLVSLKLAQVVAEETGAQTLVLNPGANLTQEQFEGGTTFLAIMEDNLGSLKKGLECDG